MKRKVLVVAGVYPPHDSTAAVEASKFTKFLDRHGWEAEVVTTRSHFPPTLPIEIPSSRIHRTRSIDVNRLPQLATRSRRPEISGYETDARSLKGRAIARLGYSYKQIVNFPDGMVGWYPFGLRAARELVKSGDFDALLTSAWPVTNHLIASRVARETGLPWLADFRDLWTQNHWFRRSGRFLPQLERALERRVMKPATIVTAPSREWADSLERTLGKQAFVVTNGFDPEDHPSIVSPAKTFTLTYTGVYYPQKQDAGPLIAALAKLKQQGRISPERFRFRLVGRYLHGLESLIRAAGIQSMTTIEPSVSHSEALELQSSSTALMMFLWTESAGHGWYSAKLYEYMGAGRPILGVGPSSGVAAQTILRLGAGSVSADASEIARLLENWLAVFDSGAGPHGVSDSEALAEFEWSAIVEDLADLLDDIATDRAQARATVRL